MHTCSSPAPIRVACRAPLAALALVVLVVAPPARAQPVPGGDTPAVLAVTPSTAALAAPADAACGPGWTARVFASVRSSVVRVESVDQTGAGVVVRTPRFVATALSRVDLGRDVVVRFASGARLRARVVAHDDRRGLALLELERDGPAPPVAVRDVAASDVAQPLVFVGPPRGGPVDAAAPSRASLNWSLQPGVLSAWDDARLEASTARGRVHPGAPAFDCAARLVGLATGAWSDEGGAVLARGAHVAALETSAGRQGPYYGAWRFAGTFGFAAMFDRERQLLGLGTGLGVVGYDRLELNFRVTGLVGDGPRRGDVLDSTRGLLLFGTNAAYRFLLASGAVPLYLTLGVGANFTVQLDGSTRLVPGGSAACGGATTAVCVERQTAVSFGFRPSLELGLLLGRAMEIRYGLQLDPFAGWAPSHLLHVGFRFE